MGDRVDVFLHLQVPNDWTAQPEAVQAALLAATASESEIQAQVMRGMSLSVLLPSGDADVERATCVAHVKYHNVLRGACLRHQRSPSKPPTVSRRP
jgi:hypothetical protein